MTPNQYDDRETYASDTKEIAALKEELKEAQKKLKALTSEKKTSVTACYHSLGIKEVFLPEDTRIRFRLGKESSQVIEVYRDSSFVSIRGDDQLAIHPVVSNVVQVKLRNY